MLFKKYLSNYTNTLSENRFLKVVIFGLMTTVMVEGAMLIFLAKQVRVVVVPNFIDKQFSIQGNRASYEYISLMAGYAVRLLNDYTPSTVRQRRQEFLRFVAPEYYHDIEAKLLAEADELIRYDTSCFFVEQETRVKRDRVVVIGIRKKFIGKEPIPQAQIVCVVFYKIRDGRFRILKYEEMDLDTYRKTYGNI